MTYEQRIEAKRERLEARADRLRREGEGRIARADKMAEAIPFGQPILVGHYSEKGDRAYRGRIRGNFEKGFEALKAAKDVAARAAAIGTGGISSDDPEATAKLREELEPLKAQQAEMTKANGLVRKGRAVLEAAGYHTKLIDAWLTPSWGGKCRAYEPYQLSNNSANIRRIEARIAHLERLATTRAAAVEAGQERTETTRQDGVRTVENLEINRLQIFFPDKPSAEQRAQLKSAGFRWAPTAGAWQRQLNNAARCAADYALKGF
jgi:hypothetical protein